MSRSKRILTTTLAALCGLAQLAVGTAQAAPLVGSHTPDSSSATVSVDAAAADDARIISWTPRRDWENALNPTGPMALASVIRRQQTEEQQREVAVRAQAQREQMADAVIGQRVSAQAGASSSKFGVAGDMRPMMPSDKRLIYSKVGFKILPFGNYQTAKTAVLDFSTDPMENVWLNYNFNSAPLPKHNCRIGSVAKTEGELAKQGQVYARCLIDAWRPWYAANKLKAPTVKVASCSLSKSTVCDDPRPFAALAATDGTIYLAPGLAQWQYDVVNFENLIAHETAHQLQHSIEMTQVQGGWSALYAGSFEPDGIGNRWLRRQETQAQCLGTAMQRMARPMTYQQMYDAGLVIASDEAHWGQASIEFWSKQAAKAQRAGECNTWIADSSLLGYEYY